MQLPALVVQLDEDVDLAVQDLRVDRLVQEIDGARFVAAERALRIDGRGRDEDDRDGARALGATHQFGEFEAVHAGHLHVDEGERHVVGEQQLERLDAARSGEHPQARTFEQRTHRDEVLLDVVDDEHADVHARIGRDGFDHRANPANSGPIRSSERTASAPTARNADSGIVAA